MINLSASFTKSVYIPVNVIYYDKQNKKRQLHRLLHTNATILQMPVLASQLTSISIYFSSQIYQLLPTLAMRIPILHL